jgi:hypothetical protein
MERKERHANQRKREGTNKIYIDKDGLWQEIRDRTENISHIKTEINPNYIKISISYNTQKELVLQCKSMFTAITPAPFQIHPKHTNTLCDKNAEF